MPTILIVEDEPNVRKLVMVNLIQRGYKVLQAENGKQAWEHLNRQKPDILILDIKLPDISGWDIVDQLDQSGTNIPVMIMTATPVDQNTILDQYPCIVEILVKPFNIERLLANINSILEKKNNS